MNKDTKIWIYLIVMIIAIICIIYVIKNYKQTELEETTMKCIASKTNMLYVSKICTHCERQKEILGKYISLFNITDCFYNPNDCNIAGINGFPTWVINGKKYIGEKSIEELKALTGCGCKQNITISNESCKINDSCIAAEATCS